MVLMDGKSNPINTLVTPTNSIDDRTKDMCPICKTDRYLSPNMNFLINPECYHKICESCVDRIFSLGPAPCPYPGCSRILRKNKFKKQVFEDLAIEREIDIRKRVSGIYNKTEEDFQDLPSFNIYLEGIENLIFNLSNGIEIEKTEGDLAEYEQDHKIEILEKNLRESQKTSNLRQYQEATERLKQEKVRIQKKMEFEDIEYLKQQQQELLDRLSSSASANSEDIIKQQQSQMLKRSSVRKKQLQQINSNLDNQMTSLNAAPEESDDEEKVPFTPFQGDRDLNKSYKLLNIASTIEEVMDLDNNLGESYYDPYVNKLAKDKEYVGGGWRLQQVFERALDEAFTGLGCFIEKEKGEKVVSEASTAVV